MTKQEVLSILHSKNVNCSSAKSAYQTAKNNLIEAKDHGANEVIIERLENLEKTAHELYLRAMKDIDDFILSDW